MKIEEAIFHLKNTPVIASNVDKETVQKAYDMAIEALEKQIPVNPLRRKATFDRSIKKLYCPVCKKFLGYENYRTRSVSKQCGDYCDCGQKISWWR